MKKNRNKEKVENPCSAQNDNLGQDDNPKISILITPQEFFKDILNRTLERQKTVLTDVIKIYLIDLLSYFTTAVKLDIEEEIKANSFTLAFQKALEKSSQEQLPLLKKIGDLSLFIRGFFAESLKRKSFHPDYYVDIGTISYKNLSRLQSQDHLKNLFNELALRFFELANLLEEISLETLHHTEKDIIGIYQKWIETGDEKFENFLTKKGIKFIKT